MRGDARIVLGIKNIGDAGHAAQIFEGTLKDSILWLMPILGGLTIAKRFQFAMARTKDEVLKGLEGGRTARSEVADDNFKSLLEQAFATAEGAEDGLDSGIISNQPLKPKHPKDDYIA